MFFCYPSHWRCGCFTPKKWCIPGGGTRLIELPAFASQCVPGEREERALTVAQVEGEIKNLSVQPGMEYEALASKSKTKFSASEVSMELKGNQKINGRTPTRNLRNPPKRARQPQEVKKTKKIMKLYKKL